MPYVVVCRREKTICVFKRDDEGVGGCRLVPISACEPHGEQAPLNWDTPEGVALHWETRVRVPLNWETPEEALAHIKHLVWFHGLRREDLSIAEWDPPPDEARRSDGGSRDDEMEWRW